MSDFIQKLADYGVNISVTLERFVGDEGLYKTCLKMLLNDKNYEALGQQIEQGNYEEAFNAGHALKGIVGNLGLDPLYEPVSEIVESLRNKDFSDLKNQFARVTEQYNVIVDLLNQI